MIRKHEGTVRCLGLICTLVCLVIQPSFSQTTDVANCVTASDYYRSETSGLTSVDLGMVKIDQAFLPDGTPVDLSVTDCNNDGQLDVAIPWSESNASRKATIRFNPEICGGSLPALVELTLVHGTPVMFYAYDENGVLVDTVSDSGSDPTIVQTLVLDSMTGIAVIEIEGAEICLFQICWECKTENRTPIIEPTPEPTRPPTGGNCVTASDYYRSETSGLTSVDLGMVRIDQAFLPDGTPVDLSVTDCNNDGQLDVAILWSESNASRKATIRFNPEICGGSLPALVELTLVHGTPVTFYAYDENGVLVDTVSDSGSDPTIVQTLVLDSMTGIAVIEIEGAEICLFQICWECKTENRTPIIEPTPEPTRPPTGGNCVTASDYYRSETSGLTSVDLGMVRIDQAFLPDGTPVDLSVTDCNNDGQLDVAILWSESNASRKATINFSSNICDGTWPGLVELILIHGTPVTFYAYDENGVLVDTVSDSGSDPTIVQTLVLDSMTGISVIEIEGAEICLLRICWECKTDDRTPIIEPTPEPTRPPTGGDCVTASDYYDAETSGLTAVDLGMVRIDEAFLPDGTPVDLSVTDCNNDGQLDVSIPWSESNASRKATINFSSNICDGTWPGLVELILIHGTPVTFYAYDEMGNLVDTVSDSGSDATVVQTLKLDSMTGISVIEIEGAEICLLRICWECKTDDRTPIIEPTPEPTRPPTGGNCVTAGDYYDAETSGLTAVDLGMVRIDEAFLPDGTPVDLSVTDCNNDGQLDVSIPWSESNALRKATINFSSNICDGTWPGLVELILIHGTPVTFYAYDEMGNLVDTVSDSGSDATVVQTLKLDSMTGISVIEIEGAEICLLRICWECKTENRTPIIEPTPEPTRPPTGGDCVTASDYYAAEVSGLTAVDLGMVRIDEAFLPDGTPVDLSVTDCNNDGQLDVSIPWSESNASRKATINFSSTICGGNLPTLVELILIHGTPVTFYAYDEMGNLVDTVSDSGSDATVVQTLKLDSMTGISVIEIEGAEICLLRICWECKTENRTPIIEPTPEPTRPPTGGDCVTASDYYDAETSGLTAVDLGVVRIDEAFLPDGTPVDLSVTDCNNDGQLDVSIPWSESNASRKATINFSSNICDGTWPGLVELILIHGTPVTFYAYDEMGNLVDTVSDSGSDATVVQTLKLDSMTGISVIEIEGAEICLLRICWECKTDDRTPTIEPTPEPTRPPTGGDCVTAGDYYAAEVSGLATVDLGMIKIYQSILPDGSPVDLGVSDCNNDGQLDVSILWSESNALQKALIKINPSICGEIYCGNSGPQTVEIILTHGTPITLYAKDPTGVVVDTVSDSGSDSSVVQTLTLRSAMCISEIEVEGAEICILRICWDCEALESTPTPEPEATYTPAPCTPVPPDRIALYEFNQINLASDGWVEIPGGFSGAGSGNIMHFDYTWDMFPSSKDLRGLAIEVKTGDVAFIHAHQAINCGGKPVLIRATLRAERPEASVALAALKGDISNGAGIDWSIATHIPATSNALVESERRLVLIYEPDSGDMITPIIQVACTLGSEQSSTVTVYLDKVEVFALEPGLFGAIPMSE